MQTKHHILSKLFGRFIQFPVVFGLSILLFACASVQVSQDYDPSYPFGSANTYGWNERLQAHPGALLAGDELLANRFKNAIENVLTRHGFIQNGYPAYLISYTYTVTNRIEVDPAYANFGFGYGRFRHGYYHGVGFDTYNSVRQYDQGKLVINIHSATTGNQIWRGTGTREVFIHESPEEITRRVYEMVEAVLGQFPPVKS